MKKMRQRGAPYVSRIKMPSVRTLDRFARRFGLGVREIQYDVDYEEESNLVVSTAEYEVRNLKTNQVICRSGQVGTIALWLIARDVHGSRLEKQGEGVY